MANTKISALTALTGANLATDDAFAVVDTSATATKRITVAELKLGIMPAPGPIGGTTPSTGAFTTLSATTGAAVGGATPGAGGLAFPATAVAVANANTLDDYEEGTWTPTITSGTGTITTVGAVAGTYTKVGRQVTLLAQFAITTNGTGATSLKVNGLPFTGSQATLTYYVSTAFDRNGLTCTAEYNPGASNTVSIYKYDGTYPGADGKTYTLSVTFNV